MFKRRVAKKQSGRVIFSRVERVEAVMANLLYQWLLYKSANPFSP